MRVATSGHIQDGLHELLNRTCHLLSKTTVIFGVYLNILNNCSDQQFQGFIDHVRIILEILARYVRHLLPIVIFTAIVF